MSRNMSCAITREQVIAETKTVTRRMGWKFLKAGDVLNLVNKTMGFKKGEHPIKFKTVRVVSVRFEPLNAIRWNDCHYEGFPELAPKEFVEMFCKTHKGCTPETIITRIEWEYINAK